MQITIFWPALALVFVTAVVWVLMYVRRLAEIRRERLDPQLLASSDQAAARLKDVTAADNFSNLLELPVLFYAVCLMLFVTGEVTQAQIILDWLYVLLRGLHSLIHVSYNRVVHRWAVYVASTICLFAMWVNFAHSLAGRQFA